MKKFIALILVLFSVSCTHTDIYDYSEYESSLVLLDTKAIEVETLA